jgi:hypothetical protein
MLRETLIFLDKIGMYDIVLPFLAIFALIMWYSISKFFNKFKKIWKKVLVVIVSIIVSYILAFLTVAIGQLVAVIISFVGTLIKIAVIGLLIFLIIKNRKKRVNK